MRFFSGSGVFVVVVMIFALAMGIDSAMTFPPGYQEPGPSLFPQLISGFILILGACFVIREYKKTAGEHSASTVIRRIHVMLLLALILYLVALPWIGFIPATLLLLVALGVLFGFSGVWRPIVLSVVTTSGLYLVFFVLLKVPLDTI